MLLAHVHQGTCIMMVCVHIVLGIQMSNLTIASFLKARMPKWNLTSVDSQQLNNHAHFLAGSHYTFSIPPSHTPYLVPTHNYRWIHVLDNATVDSTTLVRWWLSVCNTHVHCCVEQLLVTSYRKEENVRQLNISYFKIMVRFNFCIVRYACIHYNIASFRLNFRTYVNLQK